MDRLAFCFNFFFKMKTEFCQQSDGTAVVRNRGGENGSVSCIGCVGYYLYGRFVRIAPAIVRRQKGKADVEMFEIASFEKRHNANGRFTVF